RTNESRDKTDKTHTSKKRIQERQLITRGSTTGGNHHWVDGVFHEDAFLCHGAFKKAFHRRRGKQAERIVVRTRADGSDNLIRLRGRKNENEVLWRLLHDLQQHVNALIDLEDGRTECKVSVQETTVVTYKMRTIVCS